VIEARGLHRLRVEDGIDADPGLALERIQDRLRGDIVDGGVDDHALAAWTARRKESRGERARQESLRFHLDSTGLQKAVLQRLRASIISASNGSKRDIHPTFADENGARRDLGGLPACI
jgi:hypothetical protein